MLNIPSLHVNSCSIPQHGQRNQPKRSLPIHIQQPALRFGTQPYMISCEKYTGNEETTKYTSKHVIRHQTYLYSHVEALSVMRLLLLQCTEHLPHVLAVFLSMQQDHQSSGIVLWTQLRKYPIIRQMIIPFITTNNMSLRA